MRRATSYGSGSVRVAMITGPSSGIGLVIAKTLAADGFHVVAAGRSEARVTPVVDEIASDGGPAGVLQPGPAPS